MPLTKHRLLAMISTALVVVPVALGFAAGKANYDSPLWLWLVIAGLLVVTILLNLGQLSVSHRNDHIADVLRRGAKSTGLDQSANTLPLRATFADAEVDAESALIDWVGQSGEPLVLTGAEGAGKSWLLNRLMFHVARESLKSETRLIRRKGAIRLPLKFLLTEMPERASAADVLERTQPEQVTLDDLRSVAELIVLIDGVDEFLTEARVGGDPTRKLQAVLRRISAAVSTTPARFVLGCRTQTYDDDLGAMLQGAIGFPDPEVVDAHVPAMKLKEMRILPLRPSALDDYVAAAAGPAGKPSEAGQDLRALATTPQVVTLVANASQQFGDTTDSIQLPDLYEDAVLQRLNEATGGVLGHPDFPRLINELKQVAVGRLMSSPVRLTADDRRTLLSTGLIYPHDANRYAFVHFSFYEFFLALTLCDQILGYDSTLLRRLDLIRWSDLNRYLVPMLKTQAGWAASPTDHAHRRAAPVTKHDYERFCRATGWRATGWGVWPAKTQLELSTSGGSALGPAAESQADLAAGRATGVSWYDAFAYCRFQGGSLPEREHFNSGNAMYPVLEWTSGWHDEPKGLISVAAPDEKGWTHRPASPDLRRADLGFSLSPAMRRGPR